MKINTITFDDDGTPLSCDVTMSIEEAAMMTDLLGESNEETTSTLSALAYLHLDGLFNGLYKDGIEGYRQQNKDFS